MKVSLYLKLNSFNPFLFVRYDTAVFLLLGIAFLVLFFLVFFRVKLINELKQRNNVLGLLLNSVPVGVVRCLNDDNLTIKYFNKSYLRLFGNEPVKQLTMIIDKEDLFVAKRSLHKQLESGKEFEISFRATKSDGQVIWLLCRGNRYTDNLVEHLYCVLLDISASVQMERQQRIDQERYRIVAEASDSVIFEFNLKDKTIFCTNKFNSKFGYIPYEKHMPRAIFYFKFIHLEDVFKLKSMYNTFYNGSSGATERLRFKKADGTFIWCEVRFSTIFDERGLPIRAVGKIIDIDQLMRERESLIKDNQNDAFTGLINKKYTFEYIDNVIKSFPNENHALLFIDIDNFKDINDIYGHAYGDKILLGLAECLKDYCKPDDIAGRIGGDEFLLLLKGYISIDEITIFTDALLTSISSIKMQDQRKITASIGIALYPDDSKNLLDLYNKSDKALYLAKNSGRNNYKFIQKVNDKND